MRQDYFTCESTSWVMDWNTYKQFLDPDYHPIEDFAM
jgi:hypothetical protein